MTFTETVDELKKVEEMFFIRYKRHAKIYVEKISYQESLSQQLVVEGLFAEPVVVGSLDKRARISLASPYINSGRILFSNVGNEDLINQLVNFGIEKYDDLADALTIMILKIIEEDHPASKPFPKESDNGYRPITAGIMDMEF